MWFGHNYCKTAWLDSLSDNSAIRFCTYSILVTVLRFSTTFRHSFYHFRPFDLHIRGSVFAVRPTHFVVQKFVLLGRSISACRIVDQCAAQIIDCCI